MNLKNKLKGILSKPRNEKEKELRKLAQDFGCSLESTYNLQNDKHSKAKVIRRIHEAARSERKSKLWWFALISAIASMLSACAAVIAVWISK